MTDRRAGIARAALVAAIIAVGVLALVLLSGAADPRCTVETDSGTLVVALVFEKESLWFWLHPDSFFATQSGLLALSGEPQDWIPFPHVTPLNNVICVILADNRASFYINNEFAWSGKVPPVRQVRAAFRIDMIPNPNPNWSPPLPMNDR